MRTKLLLFVSIALLLLLQPARGFSASAIRIAASPNSRHCHSHYHYHHRNDHCVENFFKTRNKTVTDWGTFFDYFCIGPAGTICGIAGLAKRQDGAGIVMAIGVIETAVAAACLSR